MGTFKIEIIAIGGHGVDRSKKNGEVVDFDAGGENTPDEIAKDFVNVLTANGVSIQSAKIVHWPGEPTEVSDDLVTGVRTGNF